MVPAKSHPRYRQLLTGEFTHTFKLFSASMCVSLYARKVQAANKSPAVISSSIDDLHAFFTKYENLLTDDLLSVFG